MKSWEFYAAAIALVAGLWAQVRALTHWLRSLVICTRRTDRDIAGVLHAYLSSKRESLASEPCYGGEDKFYYIKPLGKISRIMWHDRVASGSQLMWVGRKPLWFSRSKRKDVDNDPYEYVYSYIRGTVSWEKLLIEAEEWHRSTGVAWNTLVDRRKVVYHFGKRLGSELDKQRQETAEPQTKHWFLFGSANSRRLLRWHPEDIGMPAISTIDGIALSPELLEVVEYVRRWNRSRSWYLSRRLAWRLGLLLHGGPGTGKTTFARELAGDLNMPVHILDLATMSNEDLRDAWSEAVKDGPCMVLLEDIDGIFRGRINVTPGGGIMTSGGLTFDCLLNCVDGVERADGVLLVVTTNDPDAIDPALVRPGRVDRRVEFKNLDVQCRIKIAKMILGATPAAEKFAMESGDVPAAAFSEACCRKALQELYDGHQESGGPYR